MTRIGASPCPECGGPRELIATPSMWINSEAKRTGATPYYHHAVCHACRVRWPGWSEPGRVRRLSWHEAGIADYTRHAATTKEPRAGARFQGSDPFRERGLLWQGMVAARRVGGPWLERDVP